MKKKFVCVISSSYILKRYSEYKNKQTVRVQVTLREGLCKPYIQTVYYRVR